MPNLQESTFDPRDASIRQQAERFQQQDERINQLEQDVMSLKALIESKADAQSSKKAQFAKKPVFKKARLQRELQSLVATRRRTTKTLKEVDGTKAQRRK